MNQGIITQIIGPVIDVRFDEGALPAIYHALTVEHNGALLMLEVEQHIGMNEVRTIAMSSTDGLTRGMTVTDTGATIMVPVGSKVLGRMFDVTGQAIDELPNPTTDKNIPSTDRLQNLASNQPRLKYLKQVLKSLT